MSGVFIEQLAITESTQVKTEKAENLRILVSGRDPRSRDESNGQRPRQLLPDGLGQSVGGGWQLVGEDHRNDHLGKRRLDAQIVATGLN